MAQDEPVSPPPSSPQPTALKGNCHECPWYARCPRMRGENVCYSVRQARQAAQPPHEEADEPADE